MRTQNAKKRNNPEPNLNKAIAIKMALLKKGKKQVDIAADLGISRACVSRAIRDLTSVPRVDDWVRENLGIAI